MDSRKVLRQTRCQAEFVPTSYPCAGGRAFRPFAVKDVGRRLVAKPRKRSLQWQELSVAVSGKERGSLEAEGKNAPLPRDSRSARYTSVLLELLAANSCESSTPRRR